MRKLVRGVLDFRKYRIDEYRTSFAHLALQQRPDALFIACSDSRVVPNVFASTDPGDLFVVRNVGNLFPPHSETSRVANTSELAALEFAVNTLEVTDIVVCGHSQCGAMKALLQGAGSHGPLAPWLQHGEASLRALHSSSMTSCVSDSSLDDCDALSQINVLTQLQHVATHPAVTNRRAVGQLRLHAWWFDLASADVYAFDEERGVFHVVDENLVASTE